MLCVYSPDCTDFSGNGLGTISPSSALVKETLNGEYELEIVHPLDDTGKWHRLVEGYIVRAPVPASETPQVALSYKAMSEGKAIYKVNTKRNPLVLRSSLEAKYKKLGKYKKGKEVIVLEKTTDTLWEVVCPDSKGWRVYRAKNPSVAEKIARCMEMACKNSKIGYDQDSRNTLYKEAEPFGFDVSKVTKPCETDCSALVRVCIAYAGITSLPSGFRTGNMPSNGECDAATLEALLKAVDVSQSTGCDDDSCPISVRIVGGNCYIRNAPNTDGKKLGVAHNGDTLPFAGEISDGGWPMVLYEDQKAWVSGKYGMVE